MILLDTHFVIELAEGERSTTVPPINFEELSSLYNLYVSAVSLWEIAIKYRLGKLKLKTDILEWPQVLGVLGVGLLPIAIPHVLQVVLPKPITKDPFDNLLLGICAVEGMRLLTIDRALIDHPLAWRR